MKITSIRLVTVLASFGIAFLLAIGTNASANMQGSPGTQKRKTLRDLAQERDIEVDVPVLESSVEYRNLGLLARHAEAIVVARLMDEQSTFDGDDYITTTYTLDVQRVIKDTKLNGPLGLGDEPPAPLLTPVRLARAGGVVVVNGHRRFRRFRIPIQY